MGIGEDQRLCLVTTEFIPIIIIYGGTLQPLITCTKNMNYLSPTFQSYCSKSYSIQMNEFLIHYLSMINISCIQERGGEKSCQCDKMTSSTAGIYFHKLSETTILAMCISLIYEQVIRKASPSCL